MKVIEANNSEDLHDQLMRTFSENDEVTHLYVDSLGDQAAIAIGNDAFEFKLPRTDPNPFNALRGKLSPNVKVVLGASKILRGNSAEVEASTLALIQTLGVDSGTLYANRLSKRLALKNNPIAVATNQLENIYNRVCRNPSIPFDQILDISLDVSALLFNAALKYYHGHPILNPNYFDCLVLSHLGYSFMSGSDRYKTDVGYRVEVNQAKIIRSSPQDYNSAVEEFSQP